MIGQHLLRLAYRRRPSRNSFLYRDTVKYLGGLEGDVLDLGGGPGYLYYFLGMKPYYVVQDIDFKMLQYGDTNIDRVQAMAEESVFREGSFDNIIIHDALHHFFDIEKSLLHAIRTMKRYIYIFEIEAGRILGKVIKLFEKVLGFPGNFVSSESLIHLLSKYNRCIECKKIDIDGLRYLIKISRIPNCNGGTSSQG